ncbi:hypothetical protein M569_07885, partial [Genlisea aurea]
PTPFNATVMANPQLKNYIMQLYLGSPPALVWLIIDTSYFITFTQCGPCIGDGCTYEPFWDYIATGQNHLISCQTQRCFNIYESQCDNRFDYYCAAPQVTIDGTQTVNYLSFDTITFSPNISFSSSYFGCIFPFFTPPNVYGKAYGVVSLCNNPNSLLSQIGVTKFSYCLQNMNSDSSSLIYFGESANILFSEFSTPLYSNTPSGQYNSYYLVTILSLDIPPVGRIPFPGATSSTQGNINIQPSTYLTYLPSEMVTQIVNAFTTPNRYSRANSVETNQGYSLCFNISSTNGAFIVPTIAANFVGGSLILNQQNTFVEVEAGVMCMTIVSASGNISTPGNVIWGNALQTNFYIQYDVGDNVLRIQPDP